MANQSITAGFFDNNTRFAVLKVSLLLSMLSSFLLMILFYALNVTFDSCNICWIDLALQCGRSKGVFGGAAKGM